MAIPVSRRLDFSEIPVIDIAPLFDGNAAQVARTAEALDQACSEVGFLYVRNHGIKSERVADLAAQARRFFAQPMAEKMEIVLDQRLRGYLPLKYRSYEGETRAGTSHQEGFWIGHERSVDPALPLQGPNQWPEGALGLAPDFFAPLFRVPNSRLKLNHYPPQDAPEADNDIGVVPHADSGGFTILWQDDNGGLEVQSKSGEWVGAPPIDDTFVINLGNIMQIWTNGRFSATPHRVINRGGCDRYSIPLFVNPDSSAMIEPLLPGE